MQIHPYKSDVTDTEWVIVGPLIPEPKTNGRSATVSRRELLNAMLTGCGWEWLPHDFPNWKTVYHSFREWRLSELWRHIHDILRGLVRKASGRNEQPSAAIIDSQSVKTTFVGGLNVDSMAAKRSTAASGILLLRHRDVYCWQKCMQPTSLTVMVGHSSSKICQFAIH